MVIKKSYKLLSYYAQEQKRDKSGRFTRETEIEKQQKYSRVIRRLEKEKKSYKLLSYYAQEQKRDKSGKFIKETEIEKQQKYSRVITRLEKEEVYKYDKKIEQLKIKTKEIFKGFKYLIAMDYPMEKRRTGKWKGKGSHPFYAEYIIMTPRKLDKNEILDILTTRFSDYAEVLSGCEMKIKGIEPIEENYEIKTEAKELKKPTHHK